MSRSDKMAELCEGIAAVLMEKGHTTHQMCNDRGNVCLLGAGRLAQDAPLVSAPQQYDNRSTDLNTAEALGFSGPQKVAEYNDGYTLRTRSVVPVPLTPTFVHKDEAYVPMTYREEEVIVIEEVVHPAISQQQAIDLAMDRAKYWRNQ